MIARLSPIFLVCSVVAAHAAAPLPAPRSFDFEEAFVTPPEVETTSTITGLVPEGWVEDSGWAEVEVEHSAVQGTAFEGDQHWRIVLADVTTGGTLVRVDNLPVRPDQSLRIRLALRSATQGLVALGIRNATKYNAYWERRFRPSPEWRVFEYVVENLPEDPAAQFFIWLKQPAEVEIDSVSLTWETAAHSAETLAGNLLPTSSFPLGLHPPWTLNAREVVPDIHQADPENPGPTGNPSLRTEGTGRHQLIRAPFSGPANRPYTLSLYAKASAPMNLALRMGPPSAKLYVEPYNGGNRTIGTEWKRYSFTMELPSSPEGHYLVELYWKTEETLWLDGIMVEQAETMGPFQTNNDVELLLGSANPADPGSIHFEGEELSFAATTTGDIPEGASLAVRVVDLDSARRSLPGRFDLPPSGFHRHVVRMPKDSFRPFGSYRVEGKVVDEDGQPLSRTVEWLVHRVREPRRLNAFAPDSFFGVHLSPQAHLAVTAKRLGFNWVRTFELGWNMIQEERDGPWNWGPYDARVNALNDAKLSVLGVLTHPPRWASTVPDSYRGWRSNMFTVREEFLPDWADYARRVAERYHGKVTHWEAWNEPYWPAFFIADYAHDDHVQGSPETLYAMTDHALEAVKRVSPEIHLLWNMGAKSNPEYDRKVLEAGMLDLVDGVTYHSYERGPGGFPGDTFQQAVQPGFDLLEEFGSPDVEMWNSEGGPGGGHYHYVYEHLMPGVPQTADDFESSYMARAYASMMAAGVKKFFLYGYFNGVKWTRDYDLMHTDGAVAPNAVALANTAWHTEGKRFHELLALPNQVHAYVFGEEGEASALLVPKTIQGLVLEAPIPGLRFADLYGNALAFPLNIVRETWILGKVVDAGTLAAILRESFASEAEHDPLQTHP